MTERIALADPAHLATQLAVARILAEAASTKEVLPRVLEAVGQTLGWDWAALWWEDPQEQVLRCVSVWHPPAFDPAALEAESRRTTFPRGVGLPGRVWASEEPVWIEDVLQASNFPRAPVAAAAGLQVGVAMPIQVGSQVLGVMEFFSRAVRPREDALLDLLGAVSSQVGQFLARQTALERLKESEARKAAMLEAALDCIIAMDQQGRITDFNPAAERTFGYRREDVLGRELAETIIPPALREAHRRGLAHFLATGEGPVLSRRIEITGIRANGQEFPVELAITPLEVQGHPAFVGYLRDITERTRIEEALRASERQKDEFLAVLSHDLRTPLATIKVQAQLLQRRSDHLGNAGQFSEGLDRVCGIASRMSAMLDELLDLTRLQSGGFLELRPERVDLVALAREIAAEHQLTSQRHTLQVESASPAVLGQWDRARLARVVGNLLSNAIKYSPEGGEVLVEVGQEDAWAVLAVRDQGLGIPAQDLPRLFERYYRGHNVGSLPVGTGLGLAGARQIVEQHGGSISVESQEGQGSTFTVRLPLSTDPSLAVERSTAGGISA